MNLNLHEIELIKSVIKTCDLIFVTVPENSTKGDLAKAFSSSTGNVNENCIQVGIIKNEINEEIKIIEADRTEGIICRPLKLFIELNLKLNPLKRFYIKRIKALKEEDVKKWIYKKLKNI